MSLFDERDLIELRSDAYPGERFMVCRNPLLAVERARKRANLHGLTGDFLALKYRYFTNLPYPSARLLDRILPEIKGADLRKNATRGNARQRLHAIGFLDRILGLLQRHDVRLVAHIWVKGIGMLFDATPVYTSSIQGICTYFDHYLTQADDTAFPSRTAGTSSRTSASPARSSRRSSARRCRATRASSSCRHSDTATITPVFRSAASSAPRCSSPSPDSHTARAT